jgi:PPOX class probable F420-dependent enzyme
VEEARGDAGLSKLAERANRFYDSIRRDDAATIADGEPGAQGFGHLKGPYCLVATYRRSGEAIATPLWYGVDEQGRLYFRTYAPSYKVKRIRNNARVRVAPSTMRGKPKGPSAEGTARVLDPGEEGHAWATIQSNYGLFHRVYEKTAGDSEAVYVEVTPA